MYLIINNSRYTVSRRIREADTLKFLGVTPAPDTITGTIRMFTNEDVLMSEDAAEGYLRRAYTGTLLTLTNVPEPQPQPEPDESYEPAPSVEERMSAVEEALDILLNGTTEPPAEETEADDEADV